MNMFSTTTAEMVPQAFLLGGREDVHGAVHAQADVIFTRSKERLRVGLYGALFAIDLLAITIGFLLAATLRFGSPAEQHILRTLAIVIPTFIAVALNNRAYALDSLQRPMASAKKGVEALFFGIAVAIALLFSLKVSTEFSRIVFVAGTLLSIAAVFSGRLLAGHIIGNRHRWTFANHLLIVDSVPMRPSGSQAVLYADRVGLDLPTDDPLLLHRLSHLLQNCDRVLVACPPERRQNWSTALKGTAIDIEILMPELNGLGATALCTHHGETTLLVSSGPLSLRDRILKRALDLVIGSLALILLAPLMLLVAIAIKLDSPGPILFRQQRFGQCNRIFGLFKFRSMRAECSDAAGTRSASQGDDRLTRVGKFIRRTSIDELPQIFNVLGGSMSIVGPRPHALGSTADDAYFWHIDSRYFDRHAIKPGITGLAQIRGFRGATQRRDDLTNRLQSDLEYVSGWTVWRDLKIVAATFGVLVHVNAY